jgi:hypothetical protein
MHRRSCLAQSTARPTVLLNVPTVVTEGRSLPALRMSVQPLHRQSHSSPLQLPLCPCDVPRGVVETIVAVMIRRIDARVLTSR